MGAFSNLNYFWYSQILRNAQITFQILYWTVLVKSARYCGQTNHEYFLSDRSNFPFNTLN